jgi:uncharacterized protein (DUF952 family)
MSKAKEIWDKGIGSVHGADVTQRLCYETASNLSAYARELEKEQSDLDWLEVKVTELHEEIRKEPEYTIYPPCYRVLNLIKQRREAK